MIGQQAVYDRLKSLDISFDYYEHPPVPTIEEAKKYFRGEETTLCKNLFFRNHKGSKHYLVLLRFDSDLRIHQLEKYLKEGKLTFSSERRMEKYLGVKPGSVSLFGLVNDKEHHVYVFIDKKLSEAKYLSFHPNDNRASLVISQSNFKKFLDNTGNGYEFIDMME